MKLSLALATSILGASATIYYAGVAESGGEFGAWSATSTKGTGLPGRFGVEYAFINTKTVDIFVDTHKVNLFRVAFLLERMCPLATGLGKTFDQTVRSCWKI
jgi:endoglucanase